MASRHQTWHGVALVSGGDIISGKSKHQWQRQWRIMAAKKIKGENSSIENVA